MFVNTGMGSTPAGARELATTEAAGFESLWTVEHVVVPSGYESKYPYDKSGKMAGGMEEFDLPDPLIWLTFAGAVTERIKLGTGILILPQRNPLVVAKELATLDVLTVGRVILGTGVGWLQEEFGALGVPFADRGRRHDDYVALRAVEGRQGSVHNTYANFDRCISRPVPANGSIPIVIGGHTTRAAQRAARLGDGFFPGSGSLDELQTAFDAMRAECAAIGRDPADVELTAGGGGRDFDELCTRVEQLQAMGVRRVMLPPQPGERLLQMAEGLKTRFDLES
ncbi:MAG: LLM class F420-dependent oxidoreductase [Ilumatobacteraceae bacterium]